MYSGRLVYSQLMDFLPMHRFRQCVERYNGNRHVKSFTCLDQFLCMAFAQLSYRESVRDIEACMRAMQNKVYHLGVRSKISKSTLAEANEKRDWRIYADFAQVLIRIARDLYANDDFGIELEETVYALDASTIDHRSVSVLVSLGEIPEIKRRYKATYLTRPAWQYPVFHFYNQWKSSRRKRPR